MTRRMNQDQVVYSAAMMRIYYQRALTAVHDMQVLLAEAELFCKDEKALDEMRVMYRLTQPIARGAKVDADD